MSLELTTSRGVERVGAGRDHRGTIDLWSASLEPPGRLRAHLEGCLSLDERERAARFVFPRDRERFVAGRAFLRLLLAQYVGADAASLRFSYGPHGKPALDNDRSAVTFNLAHTDALAVCALTRGADVGVDVERVRPIPNADGVARTFFSPRETAELASVPEAARPRAFFDAWTRKEAFLKALGHGLARPLDSFDVSLKPGEAPRLLKTLGDPAEASRYSLHALEPEVGYVAAIAVRGHGWELRHARWRWIEARRGQGG